MDVAPFRALRPRPDLAAKIASPPYDVLDAEEARALAANDPYSFLHVTRPEIDLPPTTDPHDDAVYERGRVNLAGFVERGWLVRDERPAYFVYRLVMDGRAQTGIVGAAAIEDSLADRIRKHEHTRPAKVEDRVRLGLALRAHPGPVFLTHRPHAALEAEAERATAAAPVVHFTAADGVEHALWVLDNDVARGRITRAFRTLERSYVADGHHRAAAAARVGGRSFLAAHFPASQLRVLDYNRLVRDLRGLDRAGLLDRAREAGFDVQDDWPERRPPRRGTFGVYLAGRWSLLAARPAILSADDPVERLDVAVLSRRLLEPVLGVGDPRTDPRIDFVGGIRGMDELESRVDSGAWALAVALWPTSLDEVMAVADSGRVMPPKSTWFEPKLRSGLVVQPLDD